MLAKLTSKNQLTLPKAVLSGFPKSDYFEVTKENGRIILTPVRLTRADAVRAKLAELGISEADVADAVTWARRAERSGRPADRARQAAPYPGATPSGARPANIGE